MPASSLFKPFEFQNWYPQLKDVSPRARILYAPESFREYLLADGIVLASSERGIASDNYIKRDAFDTFDSGDSDNGSESSGNGNESSGNGNESSGNGSESSGKGKESDAEKDGKSLYTEPPAEFHKLIENSIAELNGSVAPKLNWSAPVDSTWMLPDNSMKCICANDVYMLLKSSDHIVHDLNLEPAQVVLVLREWFDLHPSTEFRCFVNNGCLKGISQRYMDFYEFLEPLKPQIEALCLQIVETVLSRFSEKSFVLDVHLSSSKKQAFVVDINPFNEQTDSILFNWDELDNSSNSFELRLVEREDRTRTFSSKPYSTNHVPADFVDMNKDDFADLIRQMKQQKLAEDGEANNNNNTNNQLNK